MTIRFNFKFLIYVTIICSPWIYAQMGNYPEYFQSVPKFYFEVLNYSSNQIDSSRLDVYIEVPYRSLHFISKSGVFRADYELTIGIYDSINNLVQERTWLEEIQEKDYNESVSERMSRVSQKSFTLKPAKYSINVQLQETEIKKGSSSSKTIIIRNFSQPSLALSDIMLVKRIDIEGDKKIIYPNISHKIGGSGDEFYLFYEIYNNCNADSANIKISIKNFKGEIVLSDSNIQLVAGKNKSCFSKINTTQFVMGEYTAEVRLSSVDLNVDKSFEVMSVIALKDFVIFWKGAPSSPIELENALDPLIYLIDRDKLDEMKNAPPEKKKEMFKEFWETQDPTPDTDRNELKEE